MREHKYQFDYHISLENFIEFNDKVAIKSIRKAEKKSRIFGAIEVVIALFYLAVYMLRKEMVQTSYLLLAGLVLVIGLFTLTYYPVFFRRKMNKIIKKTYDNSDYFKSQIVVSFFDESCEEVTDIGSKETKYNRFEGFEETEGLVVLLFNQTSGALIPKNAIKEEEYESFILFLTEKIIPKNKR